MVVFFCLVRKIVYAYTSIYLYTALDSHALLGVIGMSPLEV